VIVVSDTSPITSLAAIDQLDLLRQLFETVIVPEAVYRELTDLPGQPGGNEVQVLPWIRVESVSDPAQVASLLQELDLGEAEAIVLATELVADVVLMDERIGRTVAKRLGCKAIGTVGILLAAKQQSLLPEVRPVLDAMIDRARFRISTALYQAIVAAAGE
jgi:predicted nucleic acid-binding protein